MESAKVQVSEEVQMYVYVQVAREEKLEEEIEELAAVKSAVESGEQ